MERILLTLKVLNMDENRIVKKLLVKMLEKDVPGFCRAVRKGMEEFGVDLEMFEGVIDRRKKMKDIVVQIQSRLLVERMSLASKTDKMLLGFSFDGKVKDYLLELPFQEARIIFMFRSRMFPTRTNFPNRWSTSLKCKYCCNLDTDEHLFKCCGYADLIGEVGVTADCFFLLDQIEMDKLSTAAQVLLKIHRRMEAANDDKDWGR